MIISFNVIRTLVKYRLTCYTDNNKRRGVCFMPIKDKELYNKVKGGFVYNNSLAEYGEFKDWATEEWLLNKDKSTDNKLVFEGYDANLCGLPNLSSRPKTSWTDTLITSTLGMFSWFNGEIWLDDVKIKDKYTEWGE